MGDIRGGKGTLGKLATDEVLYNKMRETSTNLAEATSKLNKDNNSIGKLFSDPSLYDNLTSASADLRQFLVEFRKNPKKYLTLKLTFF
jgi:phospholipid/cholesterol/gamma-HCH transport system substrate-binding protein